MVARRFISRFTPSNTEPAILEEIFVQSHTRADETVKRIRESALNPGKHHMLFVGPRGSGKTHFVSLIFHRINAQTDLRDRLRVAWLNEDESTTSFLKLLIRIHRALHKKYPDEFSEADLESAYGLADNTSASETLVGRKLIEKLDGRTLLLIVENLDELLKGLGLDGQKTWRAFMQENPLFTILATSPQLTDDISKRTSPFFGYFTTEYLKPLTLGDAIELLKRIAKINNDTTLASFLASPTGRARVRAMHHISGGNHRIYIVLSDFITRDSLDSLVRPFEQMLDELTPYYQERIRSLAPQQREIAEYLCGCVAPVTVKQLQTELFISHQTATSELKKLRDKRYVTSNKRGRESMYELSEPLMRLCLEVKENQRQTIRLIVDFLRIWYSRGELQSQLAKLGTDESPERAHVEAAIESFATDHSSPLVKTLIADLATAKAAGDIRSEVSICEELTSVSGTSRDWFSLGYARFRAKEYEEALSAYSRAIETETQPTITPTFRGNALLAIGRTSDAITDYIKAIDIDPHDAFTRRCYGDALIIEGRFKEALDELDRTIEIDPAYAVAHTSRGFALQKLGRIDEALESYEKATDIDADYAYAWQARGDLCLEVGQDDEALAAFNRAVEADANYIYAWFGRGHIFHKIGKVDEALEAFDTALKIDPNYFYASNSRGMVLLEVGRNEEALLDFDTTIEADPKNSMAWGGRSRALVALERFDEALSATEMTVSIEPDDIGTWYRRSLCFYKLGRYEDGLRSCDAALKLNPEYALALNGRGFLLCRLGRYGEALLPLREAITNDPEFAYPAYNLVEALFGLERWDDGFAQLRHCIDIFPTSEYRGEMPAIIGMILKSSSATSVIRNRVRLVASAYEEIGSLNYLGTVLVETLPNLSELNPSDERLQNCLKVWQEIGAKFSCLSVSLRIFAAGIRYLQTLDERVLFDLVIEEREILRQALGLSDAEVEGMQR